MIVIIDAYNFLKAIGFGKTLTESMIASWIARFNQYIKQRKNQIVLVFDAGPFSGVSRERHGQVEVVYAGQASTADAFIQDWVVKNATLDVLLVTSDRQIRNHAERYDVVSISSQEFFAIFNDVMTDFEHVQQVYDRSMVKTQTGQGDAMLDQLLEQATRNLVVDYNKNEYDQDNQRVRTAAKKNKRDRAILKKIEKI